MTEKEKNVYLNGDKWYAKKISRCVVESMASCNVYSLKCKIKERGENWYLYDLSCPEYIHKYRDEKKLFLEEAAKETINSAIEEFNRKVSNMETSPYAFTAWKSKNEVFYFEKLSFDTFAYVREIFSNGKRQLAELTEEADIARMLRDMAVNNDLIFKSLQYVYDAAESDELLQKQIKLWSGAATDEDCDFIHERTGLTILHSLPEEFNKDYAVDIDTLTEEYKDVLKWSGYSIAHRPYFAMQGSTKSAWTLNPHTKKGVDAARENLEIISFDDYLDLFIGHCDKVVKKEEGRFKSE